MWADRAATSAGRPTVGSAPTAARLSCPRHSNSCAPRAGSTPACSTRDLRQLRPAVVARRSPHARGFERGKSNLRLVDGEQLVELILAHYEKFDAKYKSLLPLRRVYVPEVPGEDED